MSQGCQRDALHHSEYNLIYCRHVLEFSNGICSLSAQTRDYNVQFYYMFFMLRIVRCKVHPKKKQQQAQKIVNYFDNASDVFWMENKCYCHCRNPLQIKQKKKSTHKWKLKWQIISKGFFWSLFFTFTEENSRQCPDGA